MGDNGYDCYPNGSQDVIYQLAYMPSTRLQLAYATEEKAQSTFSIPMFAKSFLTDAEIARQLWHGHRVVRGHLGLWINGASVCRNGHSLPLQLRHPLDEKTRIWLSVDGPLHIRVLWSFSPGMDRKSSMAQPLVCNVR